MVLDLVDSDALFAHPQEICGAVRGFDQRSVVIVAVNANPR